MSHFAFVQTESFGEGENPEVPDYPLERLPHGFRADDVSTASNYRHNLKHLSPPGFKWRRLFEVWLPFTAKLSVTFGNGQLHILNAACPVWARTTRLGSACREAAILTKIHRGKTRWTLTIKCLVKIRTLLQNSIPKIYLGRCKMKSTLPGIKARSPIAKHWRHCV